MSYHEQLQLILKYKVSSGQHIRVNCPFCRGYNTLHITNTNGSIVWYCFRNSCDAKGNYSKGLSLDESYSRLHKENATTIRCVSIPDPLVSIEHRSDIIDYLKSVNSYEAYINGFVDIKYAPADNRVLFGVKFNNMVTGYIGRSLVGKLPKWKKFGDCSHLFTVGSGSKAILVEDCCSACAISSLTSHIGLSILGTSLSPQHRAELHGFDNIYVALDFDARAKGLQLTRQIPNSKLILLKQDLKYNTPEEIKEIIYANQSLDGE